MVRRAREARFMGGAHVFPGGGVDGVDESPQARRAVSWSGEPEEFSWRAAALRELSEEAGLVIADAPIDLEGKVGIEIYEELAAAGRVLDADALRYLSNWVTPRGLPRRFDTRFFVVEVDSRSIAKSDGTEVFDAEWVIPADAIDAADRGRWLVEMPTRAHLEMLAGCDSIDEALALTDDAATEPVEPRLTMDEEGNWSILLPGEPGFEEAGL